MTRDQQVRVDARATRIRTVLRNLACNEDPSLAVSALIVTSSRLLSFNGLNAHTCNFRTVAFVIHFPRAGRTALLNGANS